MGKDHKSDPKVFHLCHVEDVDITEVMDIFSIFYPRGRHFRPRLFHWNERVYCTALHRALKIRSNEGSDSFLRQTIPEL